MNHFFSLNNSKGCKIFLPIYSVLKDENNSPAAATTSDHLYYFKSKQQFHGSQAPEYQNQQQQNYCQDVPHYPAHPIAQHPYPQSDPAVQMANIPRAGVGDNHPHYNPATGMPYGHSSGKGPGPHQQVSHQYTPIPGFPNRQQHQQNPGSEQINPHNLEVGLMIIYGDPPHPGIIKWIGYLPETNVLSAGIELVSTHLRQNIYTVYVVSFDGQNFHGFRGFKVNHKFPRQKLVRQRFFLCETSGQQNFYREYVW